MSKKQKNRNSTKHTSKSTKNISLAFEYHKVGELQKAADICNEILVVEPNNVEANHLLAIITIYSENFKAAIELCNKAIKVNANQADLYNVRGYALKKLGLIDEAIANYRKALSCNPEYTDAYNNLGNVLKESGQINEAIVSYKKAISIRPDYAEAYNNLGNACTELGRSDEAIDCYKKALAIRPGYSEAYMRLSRAVKNTGNDLISEMENIYVNKNISDKDRMYLGFALGKSYEDINEYKKSFDYYMEGNRLKRESYSYSSRDDYNLFEKIKQVFSKDFFLRTKNYGDKDKTPIFIVGMPRSGTSLIEQILASHPLVFGAGELNHITYISSNYFPDRVGGVFPEYMFGLDNSQYKKAGSYYIEKIRKLSESEEYIVDKMPHNFLFVGLIKSILPNAKVIYCKRDPMDNCFSIFKNYFGARGEHKYANELGELGRYYTLYLDLMEHWQKMLPGLIYDIQYEELINDQENQTRRLLDYCELPWDDVCLEFYKTKRRVATISNVQVRNPIYNDSVRLWKRYEQQLEPLRQAIYG